MYTSACHNELNGFFYYVEAKKLKGNFVKTQLWNTTCLSVSQASVVSKLNSAHHAIRAVNAMLSRKESRMLYFSYVHSTISYGIIFGG